MYKAPFVPKLLFFSVIWFTITLKLRVLHVYLTNHISYILLFVAAPWNVLSEVQKVCVPLLHALTVHGSLVLSALRHSLGIRKCGTQVSLSGCLVWSMRWHLKDLGTDLLWFVECTDTPFGAHFLITLHIVDSAKRLIAYVYSFIENGNFRQ